MLRQVVIWNSCPDLTVFCSELDASIVASWRHSDSKLAKSRNPSISKHFATKLMTHRYGIDTSVFIRLLTGDPQSDYEKTLNRFEARLEKEPQAEFFVSNQVIGEAYIALQHHYRINKTDARSAIISVLTSGLCSPANGASVMEALHADRGCGLIDRLIADDYAKDGITVLTNDQKMSRLPNAQKL